MAMSALIEPTKEDAQQLPIRRTHLCVLRQEQLELSLESVEKLSIALKPGLQVTKFWQLIPQSNVPGFAKNCETLSVPLNAHEILIFGG